jgi:hypothetical protein
MKVFDQDQNYLSIQIIVTEEHKLQGTLLHSSIHLVSQVDIVSRVAIQNILVPLAQLRDVSVERVVNPSTGRRFVVETEVNHALVPKFQMEKWDV